MHQSQPTIVIEMAASTSLPELKKSGNVETSRSAS